MKDPCKDYKETREVEEAVTESRCEWERTESAYDKETRNCTEESKQKVWDQKVQRELEELKDFGSQ